MTLLAIVPEITDFMMFVIMIFLLIPGALLIWFGYRMGENKRFEERTENTSILSEIRDHTQQKLSTIPTRGYSVPVEEIYQSYLSFNDNKLPFTFFKSDNPKSHITAHWKFGAAAYLGILGLSKHKIKKDFNVLMKLDAENSQVRCMDLTKSSSSGFSPMGGSMEFSTFKGRQSSVSMTVIKYRKMADHCGTLLSSTIHKSIVLRTVEQNVLNLYQSSLFYLGVNTIPTALLEDCFSCLNALKSTLGNMPSLQYNFEFPFSSNPINKSIGSNFLEILDKLEVIMLSMIPILSQIHCIPFLSKSIPLCPSSVINMSIFSVFSSAMLWHFV